MSKSEPPHRSAELSGLHTLARTCARVLVTAVGLFAALPVPAQADNSPDAALASLLGDARAAAAAPDTCARPGIDRLIRILCTNRIRVGVRDDYPLFGTRTDATRQGYEIDVAQDIARKLGVDIDFSSVKPATRISMLADDNIDLVIATMGDNTARETQVRFIRPHYYRSETILVGPRDLGIADWKDIRGRTICVTVGNGSNAELVSRDARLMLFDRPEVVPERLGDQTCTLAAQDDSFFDYYFADPSFAARFSEKFGFAQVPWGMGIARESSDMMARALDLISQIFHRDGIFLAAARANHIGIRFLGRQQAEWTRPECNTDTGSTDPACILPPENAELQATPFAGSVDAFETWFAGMTGFDLLLPMLKTAPAWSLFLNGVINSLVLIAGALAATFSFAFCSGSRWGRGRGY